MTFVYSSYNEFLKFLIGDLDIKLIDYIICPILAADGSHLFWNGLSFAYKQRQNMLKSKLLKIIYSFRQIIILHKL